MGARSIVGSAAYDRESGLRLRVDDKSQHFGPRIVTGAIGNDLAMGDILQIDLRDHPAWCAAR